MSVIVEHMLVLICPEAIICIHFLNISFKLFCLVKSVALLGSPRLGYYLTLTDYSCV
uniref:Uncharacterized protein n=1 Tax=Anguilla anguilla TaxID=7936 RepID=A0A0E9QNI5_ANGAN